MKIDINPAPPETRTVTITLNRYEAAAIVSVCGKVGGTPEGPRGVLDQVFVAMRNAFPGINTTIQFHGLSTGIVNFSCNSMESWTRECDNNNNN